MLDHINSWPNKPAACVLEDLDAREPCLILQQLAGAEVKRRYITGSYVGSWPFAVYARVNAKDTAARLDASKILHDLNKWFNERNRIGEFWHLPKIDPDRTAIKITMTTLPAIAERFDSGVEDYQAIFELEYKFTERS
jgi:hypothetical protein